MAEVSCAPSSPQPPCAQLAGMDDNRVIRTEVSDRLRAIGRLAEHVAEGRLEIDLAITTATGLLERATEWKDSNS